MIIGFSVNVGRNCVLFDYGHDGKGEPSQAKASRISAYLIDHGEVFLENRSKPISAETPKIVFGNMPNDDGNLLLTEEQANLIRK